MAAPKGNKFSKGRPKGTPNKVNAQAREAFQLAFEGIGGVKSLMIWASNNQTEFFKLYGRLIPIDTTSGGEPIKSVIGWIDARAKDSNPVQS